MAAANALHWLSPARAAAVLGDIHRLLDDGGILLFAEPVVSEEPFASGFEEWKSRQPPRYEQRNWQAFWDRATSLAGYDHTKLLGSRKGSRIGDGMTVCGWVGLSRASGFRVVDVLWKDADGVIIAARKV